MKNILIQADNLMALNFLLKERNLKGKIDLIYIDPPFATGSNFSISENRASTISKAKDGKIAYTDTLKGLDFLEFLKSRLLSLKDLLSPQGSIYLHIDYKIGHYVKILMDEVFGIENFKNDITRIKCNPKNFDRIGYGNVKDMILFYSKSSEPIWNEPRQKYSLKDIEKLFSKINKYGRRYTTVPIHAPGETVSGSTSKLFRGIAPPKGRHWRADVETLEKWDKEGLIEWSSKGNPRKIIFADEREGKRVQDIWEFKDPQIPAYPTEKNHRLLDLIIKTSSNVDSIVLDCFCGSGTTLKAAQLNNRKWIGIDQSDLAINATKNKFQKTENSLFAEPPEFEFIVLKDTTIK
ncbi:MAG: site-specific DNA-methyltransferase [Bacteroidia bacterium]|jgi:adenine-specific DNA-methyltransferase